MNFQTTETHEALRAKVRAFAEAEIKPIAFQLDRENRFPRDAVNKMGELGLMGLPYETAYEGAGADVLSYAIAVEELARVDILSSQGVERLSFWDVYGRVLGSIMGKTDV